MHDIITYGTNHEDPTVRQYGTHLQRLLRDRGYRDHHLKAMAGGLPEYLEIAPKYSKRDARLNARIAAWGIKPATYRQYQGDGRRCIEHYHGDLQSRLARRGLQDTFYKLSTVLPDLIEASLVKESQTGGFPKLCDLSRARGWDIFDLTRDRVIQLREDCLSPSQWDHVKRGAKLIDFLRKFPTCIAMLPPREIGSLKGVLRVSSDIPEFLTEEAAEWVQSATTVYDQTALTPEAREATANQQSDGSVGIYQAAIRTYIRTAGEFRNYKSTNGLPALFDKETIEKVLVVLCNRSKLPNGLAPRTLHEYADKLRLTLQRRGHVEEADKISSLMSRLPVLIEGENASELMSPRTEVWCRALLSDPVRTEKFETQHLQYATKAHAALEIAKIEGIDLNSFALNPSILPLSVEEKRLATRLLRQARIFGVCSAFAAIELDAAPFRKSNILCDLQWDEHFPTFFDHSADEMDPRFKIHIPTELLKNGMAMIKRGQRMPPFTISATDHGADAFNILKFYLTNIRPLFPGARASSYFFPALEEKNAPLVTQTFDGWLSECSLSIGLPLTPHNFRHGLCSIEINADPTCFPELEIVTGDTERVLRRNYAFIDADKRALDFQAKRYARRASGSAWSTSIRTPAE
ncbi:MAG: hypothetical protein VXW43_03420 [Pseudomonadota bacterium]|nr:hypothetical protein [Pseudomonadota bacterium]